jgi:signal transduction histidine kinase
MPDAVIRVLLIEDDPDDYVLTRDMLAQVEGRSFDVDWEQTYAGGLEALARDEHDVCIVDYRLGEYSGLDLLQAATESTRSAPMIMLTGSSNAHETDTAAMRAGADDFLVKGSIDPALLDRSIRYAIERRRLERRLVETQNLESLGVLAGGIAHNFNNLLFGVLGYAGRALSQVPPDSPARESIEQIEIAAKRAAELARDMLAYSGKGRFDVEAVDLHTLVEETGRLVSAGTAGKIEIVYDFEEGLPAIDAAPTQVRQAVMNILTNASEALDGTEGSIEVRADVVDEMPGGGFRFADTLLPGPYVRLEVEDTGIGMDADTLAHLFDPFFTTKLTGRGLGLAAVLGIVRGHRGAIRVASTLGSGTVYTLLFPCAPSPVVPALA